mgnify:CR=1 FL=1
MKPSDYSKRRTRKQAGLPMNVLNRIQRSATPYLKDGWKIERDDDNLHMDVRAPIGGTGQEVVISFFAREHKMAVMPSGRSEFQFNMKKEAEVVRTVEYALVFMQGWKQQSL